MWSQEGFLSHALGGSEDTANRNLPLLGVGAIDFAGSGVVHLTGGATALVATLILGPRTGRFYDSDGTPCTTPRDFPGHSIALQLLGTMILWFGCKCCATVFDSSYRGVVFFLILGCFLCLRFKRVWF